MPPSISSSENGKDSYEFTHILKDAECIGQECVTNALEGKHYHHGKVNEWIEKVTASCIKQLQDLSPNFKFITSCTICQNIGGSINLNTNALWDPSTDGCITINWSNETIICVLSLIGCAV